MNILTRSEIMDVIDSSSLYEKYNVRIDRQSAHEILTGKIEHKKKEQEFWNTKKRVKNPPDHAAVQNLL